MPTRVCWCRTMLRHGIALDTLIRLQVTVYGEDRDEFGNLPVIDDIEYRVWAKREDFTRPTDQFAGDALDFKRDSRFIVRDDTRFKWAAGMRFYDQEGQAWEVLGVAQLGTRGSYLQLLSRRVT